jgi:protein SDA1
MASAATINADRLAVLQNLVKRDPSAYSEEFKLQVWSFSYVWLPGSPVVAIPLQHASFLATLEIFKLSPSSDPEAFKALIHFLAHTAPCYAQSDPAVAALPSQLIALLTEHANVLSGPMRRAIVQVRWLLATVEKLRLHQLSAQALMLLRNRGLIASLPLLRVFFDLFRVRDKSLRELVFQHIVHDVRAVNKERRDEATNRALQVGADNRVNSVDGCVNGGRTYLQTHMYAMLASDSDVVAKRSLDVMVELYRRQVSTSQRLSLEFD